MDCAGCEFRETDARLRGHENKVTIRSRPLIGVTGPDRGGTPAWIMTWLALRRAGARAVRIRPSRPQKHLELDGLIIGGGSDIEPSHYGEKPFKHFRESRRRGGGLLELPISILLFLLRIIFAQKVSRGYDRARDELEAGLIQQALNKGIPVLGICRGAQLLNVVLGGSLHQNVETLYDEEPHLRTLLPRKRIYVAANSQLHRILGKRKCYVNALHRQAIAQLGDQVQVVAKDGSGVVQAIEYGRSDFAGETSFALGVQWHPEYLPQIKEQQRLFHALVEKARTEGN